jgi:hypothetical protein
MFPCLFGVYHTKMGVKRGPHDFRCLI